MQKKGPIYRILLYIRSFFFLLAKIPFILAIMALGFYAFYINDQGLDMMAAFVFMKIFKDAYITYTVLFVFIWAGTTWNVCRVLLGAANLKKLVEDEVDQSTVLPENVKLGDGLVIATIDPNYKEIIERLIKWVPRVLALVPYLIFVMAYVKENDWDNIFNIIVVMLIAVIHFLVIVYRRPVAKKILPAKLIKSKAATQKKAFSWEGEKNVWNALRTSSVFSNSIITAIIAIAVFIYAVAAAFGSPTDPGKPGLIILSSLIVYTLLGCVITLYANRLRVSFFLLMVLFALFVASRFNENHSVQMLNSAADTKMIAGRKIDSVYFSEWLDNKIKKGLYDTSKANSIFLVAAEGGGIRSCYWTYLVLQKLQNQQPSFYDHTFAATGASGGSMGLGFYYNYIYHNRGKLNSNKFLLNADDSVHLDAICSGDYLSRVTYGFLYPDLIQRFIPYPIESWDRAKYMANSFDHGFSGSINPQGDNLLSHNYQEMWTGTDLYDRPAILFNSTYAERGSKAIFSPFVLSCKYYSDVLDILTVTKRAVPMKEGMISSARFPALTSAGVIYYDPSHDKNGKPQKLGHLFDGGGFENTGIQTSQQTATMIKNELARKGLSNKFRIMIIYIGYGTGSMAPPVNSSKEEYKEPIGATYELASIMGGANTIFEWIYAAHGLAIQLDPGLNVVEFGLRARFDSTKHKLPLGLYLSPTSKTIMRNEVKDNIMRENLRRSFVTFNKYFNQ